MSIPALTDDEPLGASVITDVDQLPAVLTVAEAALLLRMPKNAVYELVRRGKFGTALSPRRVRIRKDELLDYLDSQSRSR